MHAFSGCLQNKPRPIAYKPRPTLPVINWLLSDQIGVFLNAEWWVMKQGVWIKMCQFPVFLDPALARASAASLPGIPTWPFTWVWGKSDRQQIDEPNRWTVPGLAYIPRWRPLSCTSCLNVPCLPCSLQRYSLQSSSPCTSKIWSTQ